MTISGKTELPHNIDTLMPGKNRSTLHLLSFSITVSDVVFNRVTKFPHAELLICLITLHCSCNTDTPYTAVQYNTIFYSAQQLRRYVTLRSDFELTKDTHTLTDELWTAILSYSEKSDRQISGVYCIKRFRDNNIISPPSLQ